MHFGKLFWQFREIDNKIIICVSLSPPLRNLDQTSPFAIQQYPFIQAKAILISVGTRIAY
jgi:hypothetical protein